MKTVVLVFHPDLNTSRVNRALAAGLPAEIEVRDMYRLYPDFKIDVAQEQAVLADADRIVLQFQCIGIVRQLCSSNGKMMSWNMVGPTGQKAMYSMARSW